MSDLPPEPGPAPGGPAEPGPAPGEARPRAADVIGDVKSGFEKAKEKKEPYGLFAFAAAAAMLAALFWWDGDSTGFWDLGLWSLFILAATSAVFAPMVRGAFSLSEQRAYQLATAGACGMAFAWIAFYLPDIQSNRSFFGTFAAAFAGLAAWMAPGRPGRDAGAP